MLNTGIAILMMGAMVLGQVTRLPCFRPGFTEEVSYAGAGSSAAKHAELKQKAKEIRRADYEDDRAGLQRLFGELEKFVGDADLGPQAHYWRGYALWRRAINGFNDAASKGDLDGDLATAVNEFAEAEKLDASFVEATIGRVSCEMNLIYVHRDNMEEARKHMVTSAELLKKLLDAAPDNPRFLWIYGAGLWYRPASAGGSQEKAMETYARGLELVRKESKAKQNGFSPDWGEPELLMSLAWSSLNSTTPDSAAAKQYAQEALRIVPKWHYVRDILVPQIDAFDAKKEAEKKSASAKEENE